MACVLQALYPSQMRVQKDRKLVAYSQNLNIEIIFFSFQDLQQAWQVFEERSAKWAKWWPRKLFEIVS
jgi:hypothetical protein